MMKGDQPVRWRTIGLNATLDSTNGNKGSDIYVCSSYHCSERAFLGPMKPPRGPPPGRNLFSIPPSRRPPHGPSSIRCVHIDILTRPSRRSPVIATISSPGNLPATTPTSGAAESEMAHMARPFVQGAVKSSVATSVRIVDHHRWRLADLHPSMRGCGDPPSASEWGRESEWGRTYILAFIAAREADDPPSLAPCDTSI